MFPKSENILYKTGVIVKGCTSMIDRFLNQSVKDYFNKLFLLRNSNENLKVLAKINIVLVIALMRSHRVSNLRLDLLKYQEILNDASHYLNYF